MTTLLPGPEWKPNDGRELVIEIEFSVTTEDLLRTFREYLKTLRERPTEGETT